MHLSVSLWRSLALKLALTWVLNWSTGSFPTQNPCPVPSGAGVPAHQGTGARPTLRYSTFQPQVLYIPVVPGSRTAYLRIVAQIAMSRDNVQSPHQLYLCATSRGCMGPLFTRHS